MTVISHLDRVVAKVTSRIRIVIGIVQKWLELGFWELELKLRIGIGNENPARESIFLDFKSSVIFSSSCFVVKTFAFQRLKFRHYLSITAHFV